MGAKTKFASLVVLAALALPGCRPIKDALPWQSFSMNSTSMEPTVPKGTYLTGVSVKRTDLAHGDLLVVRHGDEYWVSRLAAKPGDRIAMVHGKVVLNGKPIQQIAVGTWTIADSPQLGPARMLSERFPGESRTHRILDSSITFGDNFAEMVLGSDQYFMLGDNRDHAADSRYGEPFGLGLVKGADILRRVDSDEI